MMAKLNNRKRHSIYNSPHRIKIIKTMMIRGAGIYERNVCTVLVVISKGRRPKRHTCHV
jgi:hypothetical protein